MRILLFAFFAFVGINISDAQTIIQMEKKNGVYYVPCKVNGLQLSFIFDTGASQVIMSTSEANFMIKNGYMSTDDIVGAEYMRIANGRIEEGTRINIKKLEIGGRVLTDIQATVMHTADAPLLLGQSVLERFGSFKVDYANLTLELLDWSRAVLVPDSTPFDHLAILIPHYCKSLEERTEFVPIQVQSDGPLMPSFAFRLGKSELTKEDSLKYMEKVVWNQREYCVEKKGVYDFSEWDRSTMHRAMDAMMYPEWNKDLMENFDTEDDYLQFYADLFYEMYARYSWITHPNDYWGYLYCCSNRKKRILGVQEFYRREEAASDDNVFTGMLKSIYNVLISVPPSLGLSLLKVTGNFHGFKIPFKEKFVRESYVFSPGFRLLDVMLSWKMSQRNIESYNGIIIQYTARLLRVVGAVVGIILLLSPLLVLNMWPRLRWVKWSLVTLICASMIYAQFREDMMNVIGRGEVDDVKWENSYDAIKNIYFNNQ